MESSKAGPSKTKSVALRKRLTNAEVAKFLVDNDIKTETQLMSIAKQGQSAEEPNLFNFILNKAGKSLSELIATTWKMHNAKKNNNIILTSPTNYGKLFL